MLVNKWIQKYIELLNHLSEEELEDVLNIIKRR